MRGLDGARGRCVCDIVWIGMVAIILGWAVVGGASAGALDGRPKLPDQIEALAFDPFRLVTNWELLTVYEAVLRRATGTGNGQSSQSAISSSTGAPAPNDGGDAQPVRSSTTAGITSLTSAAALVKAFVGQALLISPRPPLRTPTQPTWP